MEFPHTAVIHVATKEDLEALFEIFQTHNFYSGGSDSPFEEISDMGWDMYGNETCYDIEGKCVNWSSISYYENDFESDFPGLIPDDPIWFICTVQDFIAMCNNELINVEFDIADENDLIAMLGG